MKKKLKIGIQGQKGSFNEEALAVLAQRRNLRDFETVYCRSTRRVLAELAEGRLDRGVFAVYNSRSRMVDETAAVLRHYPFDVVDYVTIAIGHCLLALPGVSTEELRAVYAHGEAIAQCRRTLAERFGRLRTIAGEGDLIDGAAAAAALAAGELDRRTAVLGSAAIADGYGLRILARDLQDDPHNTTTFLFVRPWRKD